MSGQSTTELDSRTFTERLTDTVKNPYVEAGLATAAAAVGVAAAIASRGKLAAVAEKCLPEISITGLFGGNSGKVAESSVFADLTSGLPKEQAELWKRAWAREAENPALLNELAATDKETHRLLLENKNLPPSALNKIAEMHPEAPPPGYKPNRVLWGDEVSLHKAAAKVVEDARDIRQLVALHPNADDSVLNKLALDNVSRVRGAVLENPNVSSNTLHTIATQNAKYIIDFSGDADFAMQARIAAHPNVNERTMLELAKRPWINTFEATNTSVKDALLQNPRTPNSVLTVLAEKTHPIYTEISPGADIARHQNASAELLAKLWNAAPSSLLQTIIRFHPNVTPELEQEVMANGWLR